MTGPNWLLFIWKLIVQESTRGLATTCEVESIVKTEITRRNLANITYLKSMNLVIVQRGLEEESSNKGNNTKESGLNTEGSSAVASSGRSRGSTRSSICGTGTGGRSIGNTQGCSRTMIELTLAAQ